MTRDDALSKLLPLARDVSVIAFAALVLAFATDAGLAGAGLRVRQWPPRCCSFSCSKPAQCPAATGCCCSSSAACCSCRRSSGSRSVSVFAMWQPALMLLSVLGVARFAADLRESGWLRLALAFFFMYLMFGIVSSSVIGRTRTLAGLYQFISDLKPMLLVMLGYALRWDDRMERWLWIVVRWAWLPMLVCVAFEWAGARRLLQGALRWPVGPSPYPFGLVPSRALGLFDHPSFLATTSALFVLLIAGRACTDHAEHQERTLRWVALGGIYGVLLLCSIQRQEMVALAVALPWWRCSAARTASDAASLRSRLRRCRSRRAWQCCWPSHIDRGACDLGLRQQAVDREPARPDLRRGIRSRAAAVALRLGTGHLRRRRRGEVRPLALPRTGLQVLLVVRQAGLPDGHLLAEPDRREGHPRRRLPAAVLPGAVLLRRDARRVGHAHWRARYWLAAAGMMVYMLLLSFTSPAFQDPRLFLLPAAMFGIASQCDEAARHRRRSAPGRGR